MYNTRENDLEENEEADIHVGSNSLKSTLQRSMVSSSSSK